MYYLVEDMRPSAILKYFYAIGSKWSGWDTTIVSAITSELVQQYGHKHVEDALKQNPFLKIVYASQQPVDAANHPELLI